MLTELRSKIKSNSKNLTGLFLIQGANAIFPLAILPYAYSVIGSKPFSAIVVSEALVLILLSVVLYSHDIEGVKWLANIEKDDHKKKSEIFSRILWTRIYLVAISVPLLLLFLLLYDKSLIPTTIAWTPIVIGHVLYSAWFFQATEDNLQIGLMSAAIKLAAAPMIAGTIWIELTPILIPTIISLAYLISGVAALQIARSRHQIRIKKIAPQEIWTHFKGGRHIFFGNISILLFRGTNTLILNHFSSDSIVSAYALAEKVIKTLQATLRPINQLLHTKLLKQLSINPSMNSFRLSLGYLKYQILLISLAFCAGVASYLLLKGLESLSSAQITLFSTILLMWPAMAFGTANFILGNAALNATNKDRAYSWAVFASGAISIVFSIAAIKHFELNGAIAAYVVGEALLLSFILYIHKKMKV